MEEQPPVIGPYCQKAGITSINPLDSLASLDKRSITNGIIFELFANIRFKDLLATIRNVYNVPTLAQGTLRTTIARIKAELTKVCKLPKRSTERGDMINHIYNATFWPIKKRGMEELPQNPSKKPKLEFQKENDKVREANKRLQKRINSLAPYKTQRIIARKDASIQKLKRRLREARALKRPIIITRRPKPEISQEVHKITVKSLKKSLVDLKQLREENAGLQAHILELEEKLTDREKVQIPTKIDGKRINPKLKAASMFLQNLGVAEHNISEAIKLIVEAVTPSELEGSMPSRSTHSRIGSEMKALAIQEVQNATINSKNMTLKYDGTTDSKGRHVTEVELATENETFLIAMRSQASGTAADYASTIEEAINDLDPTGKVMTNISNTMTDRHIVNTAVDGILEQSMGRPLNKLRCSMHPLDTFNKTCDKVMANEKCGMDNKYSQMPFMRRGESMPQALLRTIDKLFHNAQLNLGEDLSTYLRGKGMAPKKNDTLYPRWVGNKFNILFRNATYAYLYTPHIITFLTKVRKSDNYAAKACLYMLQGGDCHDAYKCLGIIDTYISGPWQAEAGKDENILEMNEKFHHAQQKIEAWIQEPQPLFTGVATEDCFGEEITSDEFTKKVREEGTTDSASRLIQKLLQALLATINKQLADQLPGGVFWEPSQSLRDEAKSCTATNISGERQFAKMKSIQRKAPNMTMTKVESRKMFEANKIKEKMLGKTEEEVARDIHWATKRGAEIRKDDQKRERRYKERVRDRLETCRKGLSASEEKKRTDMEGIVEGLFKYGGYWRSAGQMEAVIEKLGVTKKKEALRAQIKVRLQMLDVKVEGERLKLSKSTLDEQTEYMRQLMQEGVPAEKVSLEEVLINPESIIGKRIAQTFENDDGSEKIWTGIVHKVVVNEHMNKEFEFIFDANPGAPCYAQTEEIVVDIASGDLSLQM